MRFLILVILFTIPFVFTSSAKDGQVVTVIKSATLEQTARKAENEKIIDISVKHVEAADGNLGIGVLHRPIMKSEGPITAILHHKQSEIYRIMAGSGTLATSNSMSEIRTLDPDGFTVKNLTGPSDFGKIVTIENSQHVTKGDIVIIPAGIAHGFSEITEAIDYMVVRIDPDKLVALK
ncbi:MAG: hypothetical protein HOH19_15445 [Kordiimonadaceae bacterium]|jgi:mannose-6-phosphate isomerase-like protein (cupin superfamily)|nr:hypothetical protein [Kordiimonadaceae bacterium]MBT6033965.1 hypothetical protein [Kordiimonadaceae bacterium]